MRVYLSGAGDDGRAHVRAVDVDLETRDVSPADEPVLAPGELGAFDDGGVVAGCLVRDGARRHLYYSGRSAAVTVPFVLFIGCATSVDGGPFQRVSPAPVLDRSDVDPLLVAAPWVIRDDGRWRMWYAAATEWRVDGGAPTYRYDIRHAESRDGLEWTHRGHVCVAGAGESDGAPARPCVVRDGDRYRMWLTGLVPAESADGLAWKPLEGDSCFAPDEPSTDPCIIEHGGRRVMLYGAAGGVAWAEEA